jgi:hypothetical protein
MSEDVPIVIDYRKSFAEMLRDVAVSCLDQKDHNLRFLGYAGMWGSGHMPATWIPDWLIDVPLIEFPKEFDHATTDGTKQLYNASAPEHPLWQEKLYCGLEPKANGNTLVVPGIIVDYIRTISVAPGEESTLSTLEISWMLPNMDEQYLATNEILETAYLRTLVADLADSDGEISGRGGSMYWRHKDVKPANHVNVQQLMYRTCKYRKFLTTQKHRYIGLGPMWAKQGDAIFMLKGGEMLYIARPTLEGTYHFVGEAYVHGMMDGAVVDRYARGEGTMQMVEFAPVRTKVMDSSNVSNDPTKSRVSQSVTEIAPNVQRLEFTNPYERLGMFFHTDVGPRAEDLIAYLTRQTMVECSRHGINTPEAFIKVLLLTGLADASEENAVKQYDVGANVSGSSSGIAGREFAIRDHIRAAFRQARDETETMLQGQVQSSMNTGEVLLATRAKKEKSPETNQEQVTSDDEKLARQLQEEEYLATDPASHASSSHPTPTPQRQTSPREADGPPVPVPSRRRGPPVRLVQSNTHNPRTHSYQFQSKADFNEFAEELRQLASLGKTPPVLWGKWATDPKKRPKVEITTSGHPGELWWEDEFGNVVPGPVETDDDNGDENASGEEQLEKGVTEGKEDINENMEKSKMVYKDPQEWIKDSESKGVEIFGMPVEPLPVLVTTGGWEGIGEAPTPATFDLV